MLARNYIGTTPEQVITVDQICTIHRFEYPKRFVDEQETHDFWEMVYVESGELDITGGHRRFSLSQGEACFHMPGEPHGLIALSDGVSEVFTVSFSIRSPDVQFFCQRQMALSGAERALIQQILQENARTFAGAPDVMNQTQLIRRTDAAYGGEQMIAMLLQMLLIQLIRGAGGALPGQLPSAPRGEPQIVDAVIAILSENLYSRLTLDEICQRVMFSKSYVGMKFKNRMGCGVISYFDKLKINAAKHLISEGGMSFTAIAHKLQFGSIHYFSRTFKAYVGMSPSAYAKSVRARAPL